MTILYQIKEIEERCNAASEGPWEFNTSLYTDARIWIVPIDSGLIIRAEDEKLHGQMKEIAEFIAHSRTDVPKLCKALRVCLDTLEFQEQFQRENMPAGCNYDDPEVHSLNHIRETIETVRKIMEGE